MIKRMIFLGIFLFLSFLFPGCQKSGEKGLGEKELVRINDVSISLEEFQQMLEKQPLEGKMRLVSEKGTRDFLENYVIPREVLYQEANQKGFGKKKEILAKIEDAKRAILIDALLEEGLKGKGEVSEEEVQRYYKDNQALFTEPQEIKIRQIVVNTEPALKEVVTKLSKGESFEKIASTYNIGKFKEDGGNLGYIRRGQLAPSFAQFEEAAFSLRRRGEVSEVVSSPYGYHIIRLEDTRGSTLRPLNQVKERVRFFLQPKKKQEAYLEYVKEARSKAKVLINEKLWTEEKKREVRPKEGKK
ncbi:MAG TPA: peptidyl-prolyl cis-trans isomerase [Thermodesulfobacteriota bacterium]|jgi:peptidyl-prolyl cis-trans isomerase C|nr:peptidyl-prolyl cis-trans isomerase [Thermodesulfobacteriota bacterium]